MNSRTGGFGPWLWTGCGPSRYYTFSCLVPSIPLSSVYQRPGRVTEFSAVRVYGDIYSPKKQIDGSFTLGASTVALQFFQEKPLEWNRNQPVLWIKCPPLLDTMSRRVELPLLYERVGEQAHTRNGSGTTNITRSKTEDKVLNDFGKRPTGCCLVPNFQLSSVLG